MVIGVGAIGRQVALQLAAMGTKHLTLYDHDNVEVVNLAPQGYLQEDLGEPKVDVTAKLCRRLNPAVEITTNAHRFTRSSLKYLDPTVRDRLAVFCCVDSISTRKLVWESVAGPASVFIDGRMSAEVVRVLTSTVPPVDRYYPATLFEPAQAHSGPCTARSTIYTASIAAGLMLGQFTRWLRELPVDHDLSLNLLTSELSVT
jgi:sulfur carrier protein ThiS adenylyltransferase